jgi:RND family efflux transporter MFP subunit
MDARVERDSDLNDEAAPRRRRPLLRAAFVLVLLAAGGVGVYSYMHPAPQAPPMAMAPPGVTVSTPLKHKLATFTTFTGQFEAVDRVEIRAQVSGYLTEIHFKDGQMVKKGDLLFVIDPRPYEIALATAKSQLATATATLSLAKKQLARTNNLVQNDYASRETLDQRQQAQDAGDAALEGARAAVRQAELNMEWTHVVAPISGRISMHRVSVGNLIVGGQAGGATTLLTTVVSEDPIYLSFDMGEGDYVAYQRYLHNQQAGAAIDHTVDIALSDETSFRHKGTLDFMDNEMDRASGTIRARATVPNPDFFIAAGQFARLRLPTSSEKERMLVPEAALATDQSNTMVMTVTPDNTVVPKIIQIGAAVGDLRIVKSGLAPDERIVIDGLMYARPGGKVSPKPGAIQLPPGQG